MLVAKRQKMGDTFSPYLFLSDTNKDSLSNGNILKTKITIEDVSKNPDDEFEVHLDTDDAYIVDANGNEIDTGYTSKELRKFFWCQII